MKNKIFLMAFFALLTLSFTSCKKSGDYPILYVVNGTNNFVDVYCDNIHIASVGAHNNSGKTELSNVSINLPVYVEVCFYDSKNNYIGKYEWHKYYFKWNKSYKMTLTSSGGQLTEFNN